MKVLVVGSGAREHAICWRLASEGATVLAAPGNLLMADVAEVRPGAGLADGDAIVRLAQEEKVDLVVVGPEAPLVDGLVDRFNACGVPCFGPTAAAARLEASKSFAREVCTAAAVPMAAGRAFDHVRPALEYAERYAGEVVVKADGLAAGKGVSVCDTLGEAERAVRDALELDRFGASGRRVVIEERLDGLEASVIAICDGRSAAVLPAARDHKRLLDGDRGPNTGGMGAYSPLPELDEVGLLRLREELFLPVLAEMYGRGIPFRGALFAGLMLTAAGPRLLEFNARLGDPETQVILPRLERPIAPLLFAAASGGFDAEALRAILAATGDASVGVTLAVQGYPDAPRTGDEIDGLDVARADGALIFGAGVRLDSNGRAVTAGGRVLTVVGRARDVAAAAEVAYAAAESISFDGRSMRSDIGRRLVGVAA
jgi:phosphoribosylamine--glycine ligase